MNVRNQTKTTIFFENTYELDTLINRVAMTSKAVKLTVTFASK